MNPQRDPEALDPEALDPQGLNGDRSWLSAAADGDAAALDRALRCWRDDTQTRAAWHRHHMIGDVLRSAELAQPDGRDEVFLQGIRARLAAEPVVLAPQPQAKPHRATSRWAVPAAVAAGFVVVAGVLVVSRTAGPELAPGPQAGASGASGLLIPVATQASTPLAVARGSGTLLRDARVDELLRAHQSARGGMAVPGSALRRVDNVVALEPGR